LLRATVYQIARDSFIWIIVENVSLKFWELTTHTAQEYRKYAMHVAVKNLCRCDAFSLFLSFSPMSSLFPWAFAYVNRSLYYLCTWYLINAVTSHVAPILYQFSKLDKCCCRKRNIYIKKFGKRWFYLRLFFAHVLSLLFLAKKNFFLIIILILCFFSNWIKIYSYLVDLLVQ